MRPVQHPRRDTPRDRPPFLRGDTQEVVIHGNRAIRSSSGSGEKFLVRGCRPLPADSSTNDRLSIGWEKRVSSEANGSPPTWIVNVTAGRGPAARSSGCPDRTRDAKRILRSRLMHAHNLAFD